MVFLFAGIGAGFVGQVGLSVLGVLLAIASVAYLSMQQTKALREDGEMSDLTNEERSQLAPIRKLRNEIAETVQAKNSDVSVSVVGAEAIQEANRILDQCSKLIRLRKDLKKSLFSHVASSKELTALEADLAKATSEPERQALEQALEARKIESAHYGSAEQALQRIDASLRQAEAALSEMKARLATSALPSAEAESSDELEATIGRLKSLGTSLEEAEEWLKGQA